MTYKEFHNKTVKLLPSADIKAAVKAQGHVFGEKDLLKIIDMYSPTIDDKIRLFGEAAEAFSEKKNIEHAKKLAEHNVRVYEKFMTPSADEVYEVDIKCDPLDNEETYIVRTFEDALATVKAFLKYYKNVGARDRAWSLYTVTKKTVGAPRRPRDLYGKLGITGECTLGKGLKIKDIYARGMNAEFRCKPDCDECGNKCIACHDVAYPVFLDKYELVAFHSGRYVRTGRDLRSGYSDIEYGVNITDMREFNEGSPCVVALDNEYIKERKADTKDENGYYPVYGPHDHPDYAELFKPDVDSLPHGMYDDYLYAAKVLKKLDEED